MERIATCGRHEILSIYAPRRRALTGRIYFARVTSNCELKRAAKMVTLFFTVIRFAIAPAASSILDSVCAISVLRLRHGAKQKPLNVVSANRREECS